MSVEQHEADLAPRLRARKEIDRHSFHLAIECIVCNLAALIVAGLDWPLAVPRSSGAMWAKGRYREPVYGQHFLTALNLMAEPEVGLIDSVERGYRFTASNKRRSTVKPTAAFVARVRPALTGWESFARAEEPEVLILKGPKDRKTGKAEAIDYRETDNTRRMRKEVQRINQDLRDAPLKLMTDDDGRAICFSEEGQPVDPTRRSLRRIFNNGTWYEGGRLFDGFWETMRREDRFKFLRICTKANPDGERIANVDFGQLFPTLAYNRSSLRPPDGDLYDIVGDGSSREGWKKLVNAMLFAKEPMTRWPEETSQLFSKGTKLKDALALAQHFHAPIAKLFGTGLGHRLMLIESGIMIEALAEFARLGITALQLYDSVLVAKSEAAAAEAVMTAAFALFTNDARARVKVTFG